MSDAASLEGMLEAHHQLDFECRNRKGRPFISDWYCEHPFVSNILTGLSPELVASELADYYFQNDSYEVHEAVCDFHVKHGERPLAHEEIFITAGLSPLITAQMLMLKKRGIDHLYYVKPLYYTFYFLAKSLGLQLIPVNEGRKSYSGTTTLCLPTSPREWLLICDPIWFMGKRFSAEEISLVRDWQLATGGFVLIDGAFQYQRWQDNHSAELTSLLVESQVIRNLCPTKTVAIHGPRFAYSILPPFLREDLRYVYANTAGSGSVFDRAAAVAIMNWLNSHISSDPLVEFIISRHDRMLNWGLVDDPIGTEASYFSFLKIPISTSGLIAMDQTFFDTRELPGYVRFNWLMKNADLLAYIRASAVAIGLRPEAIVSEFKREDRVTAKSLLQK